MSVLVDAAEDILGGAVDLVEDVLGVVGDAIDWVVDEIVQPVLSGVGDIIDYALDNPIEALATLAVTIAAPYAAPFISSLGAGAVTAAQLTSAAKWVIPLASGTQTLVDGGSVGDAVKSAAISFAGTYVGKMAGTYITPSINTATAKVISNTQLATTVSGVLDAGTKAATKTFVKTGDLKAAAKAFTQASALGGVNAGLEAATDAVVGNLDQALQDSGFSETFNDLAGGVKDSIYAGIAAEITGQELTSQQILNALDSDGFVTDLVNKYVPVADFMDGLVKDAKNSLGKNLSETQIKILSDAVTASWDAAKMGNPDLSGEEFFKSLQGPAYEELIDTISDPIDSALDSLTGNAAKAEVAAAPLNEALQKTSDAAAGYNAANADLNSRVLEQERLQKEYTDKKKIFDDFKDGADLTNPYNTEFLDNLLASVNEKAKAFNDYADQFKIDLPDLLEKRDEYKAIYDQYEPTIEGLQAEYDKQSEYIISDIEDLDAALVPMYSEAERVVVNALRPGFNEAAYRKAAGLPDDADVYSHYLSQGQSLPTSEIAVDRALDKIRWDAAVNMFSENGIRFYDLEPEQINAIMELTAEDISSFSTATTNLDFNKYLSAAEEATPKGAVVPETYDFAEGITPEMVVSGEAVLTHKDGKVEWNLPSVIQEDLATGYTGVSNEAFLAAITSEEGFEIAPGVTMHAKTGVTYNAPSLGEMIKNGDVSGAVVKFVTDLNDDTGEMLDTYINEPFYDSVTKLYNHYLKDTTAEAALGNTASIVVGAGGEILQAVAGLTVLAGNNPNNALGRAAKNMIALSGDLKSDEWKAAAAEMEANSAAYDEEWRRNNPGQEPSTAMKGVLKAKAIWGNIKDHPVQWLSENVASELLQEIPLLLASGGTGNIAKRLLMEAGEAQAKKVAARVAIGTGITIDAAEAFGGTASGAFDEAYAIALDTGMSDQDATDYAIDVAQKAGSICYAYYGGNRGCGWSGSI